MCNRDFSVLISMLFEGEEGSVLMLEKDAFLLKAFIKVQKIGKELKSNGTSNIARFLERNRFTRLGKTGRIALVWVFLCLHFTFLNGPLLVGFLSRSSDTLSGSLRSGILFENHSDTLVI